MQRNISFLTECISKSVIDLKLSQKIKDAFHGDVKFDDVPETAGIYIMISDKQEFIYPKKKSNVFYIGTSNNLRRRLKKHKSHFVKVKADFNKHEHWIYSRYNYAVSFGCDIYWIRITGRENEKELERKALESFYNKFGAIPVANGAFSFGAATH